MIETKAIEMTDIKNEVELYLENGERASLYDVAEWWIEHYPEDIFVREPEFIVQIRILMEKLMANKKQDERICRNCPVGPEGVCYKLDGVCTPISKELDIKKKDDKMEELR